MLNRKLIIVAIAAALPTLASAQSRIPVDPWVVYAPNPVADRAPSAPMTSTIPVDPWVVYSANPVAEIKNTGPAQAARQHWDEGDGGFVYPQAKETPVAPRVSRAGNSSNLSN